MGRHRLRTLPKVDEEINPGFAVIMKEFEHEKYPQTFVLQAHSAIRDATPVACKNTILRNDLNMNLNEWANLLNSLALINQTTTGCVSLCGPTYYAHKLCTRISEYLAVMDSGEDGFEQLAREMEVYIRNTPNHCYL